MKKTWITAILMGTASLLFAAPATLTNSVTYNGETITMRLTKETLRGSEFELWSQNASGTYDVITPVDERSYMGTVDGYPGAVSCGILQDDGQFRGAVYFDRGATWFTLGTGVVETRALDYSTFSAFQTPSAPTVGAGQAGSTMYAYDLGVDADYDYFNRAGNNVAKAFEGIEYSVCVVRAIYMRDALLRPYLGRVIIRSTLAQDPYVGLTSGGYLRALRAEWNTNHTDTEHDLVSGVSPTKLGGGLSWMSAVGGSNGYSINQSKSTGNFDVVFRHEMGHNWGCGHFVGGSPEGKGIMGGNVPARFSGCELYVILNHRNAQIAHLDAEGIYSSIELPPYASLDAGEFIQSVDSSITINVLANDHDANGQAVSLYSHDGASANGGTVIQQGQNLVYTPSNTFLGADYFLYTITDTAGRTATGVVTIAVQPGSSVRLYLPLDETSGSVATDYSLFETPGTLSGTYFSLASIAGVYGNAINLDGINDRIAVPNVRVDTNTVTFTAWIKQGATQNEWAGIIFDRTGPASGLSSDNGELRYHWNGGGWDWSSGLTPPADIWTFVALVIEPTQATIYMNPGSGFQTAVRAGRNHTSASFGTTYIGWDSHSLPRHFKGAIDDVRIYNHAMSQDELQNIYEGGAAENPSPIDGMVGIVSSTLKWSPGINAIAHDVYVGTSQTAVANATKTSPEYKRMVVGTEFIATLSDATQYYWRIDTVTSSSTLTGPVWTFTTGTVPVSKNSILINFDQGGDESFAGGELIGPTSVDSAFWNAGTGASGSLSNLMDNAGADTEVDALWYSAIMSENSDGATDDENRLSVGYLDDGEGTNSDGKGVLVTFNNIPYDTYKVYGLFASGQSPVSTVNFNVNGSWVLGGNASTTAAAWGTIYANYMANGEYWTEIDPGSVQGNYWTVDTTGTTCSIIGELPNESNRGSLTAVIIEAISYTNASPVFTINQMIPDDALDGVAYGETLAGSATDTDISDTLTYSKLNGPTWLSIASDGTLSGTPNDSDIGANIFLVRVSDGKGGSDTAILRIAVVNVEEAPVFTNNPIIGSSAIENEAYSGTLVGSTTDEDIGDTVTYSKVDGSEWLSVAGNGALTGTPVGVDEGLNTFIVRATDSTGLMADATLNIEVHAGQTFHSTDTPITIGTSSETINSTLEVNGMAGGIFNVDVELDITHTYDSDLVITLIAPDATEILLVSRRGYDADNFTSTILDDSASQAISEGSAPFTGVFNPEEPLSGLNGKVANGTWTLRVEDKAPGDGGSLNHWSLKIELPEDGDQDGMADAWERLFFPNGIDALPDGHADADPQSNLDEFIAGTNPTNAESYFSIVNHAMSDTHGFVVEWPSVAGRFYSVRWTDSLTNSFQILEDNMEFPQGSYTDTVHHVDGQGFYEVDVRLK